MLYRIQAVALIAVMSVASAGAHAFAVGSISFRLVPGPQVTLDVSTLVGQSDEGSGGDTQESSGPGTTTIVAPVISTPIGTIDGSGDSNSASTTLLPPIDVPELVEEIVEPEETDLDNVPPTGSKDGKTDVNVGNDDWWLKVPIPNTLLLLILGLGVLLRGGFRGRTQA